MTRTVQEFHDAFINLQPIDLHDFKEIISELLPLEKCPQDPRWHGEGNVLNHTNMACQEALIQAQQIEDPLSKVVLYLSALLHDVGKPETTFEKAKDDGTTKIVAYGHEKAGVYVAREFLRKYFPEFDYKTRERILSLVEYHGHPKKMAESESDSQRYRRLSFEVETDLVYHLEHADFRGRITEKHGTEILEAFKAQCEAHGVWGKYYTIPDSLIMSGPAYSLFRWWVLFHHVDENDMQARKEAEEVMGKGPYHQLLLMVGAPGAGKTTFRTKLLLDPKNQAKLICMDDERARLCGNPNDMSRNQEVFDNCFREFLKSMKAKESVVWDATSYTRKARRRLLDVARDHGALIGMVYFDLPLATLLTRNENREKKVPEQVVRMFHKNLEAPKAYECDQLLVVDK